MAGLLLSIPESVWVTNRETAKEGSVMLEKGKRANTPATRPYTVSTTVRDLLQRRRPQSWWKAQRSIESPRRYWLRAQRAYCRNLIRGDLVAHRRMFGVSHKHVQPGQTPAEQQD